MMCIGVEQSGIHEAIDQWRTRLHSCIQATGGHYLNKTFVSDSRWLPGIYISQGSVAMCLRCGGIFDGHFITRFLLNSTVKEFSKIGQQLPRLWARERDPVFVDLRVLYQGFVIYTPSYILPTFSFV